MSCLQLLISRMMGILKKIVVRWKKRVSERSRMTNMRTKWDKVLRRTLLEPNEIRQESSQMKGSPEVKHYVFMFRNYPYDQAEKIGTLNFVLPRELLLRREYVSIRSSQLARSNQKLGCLMR